MISLLDRWLLVWWSKTIWFISNCSSVKSVKSLFFLNPINQITIYVVIRGTKYCLSDKFSIRFSFSQPTPQRSNKYGINMNSQKLNSTFCVYLHRICQYFSFLQLPPQMTNKSKTCLSKFTFSFLYYYMIRTLYIHTYPSSHSPPFIFSSPSRNLSKRDYNFLYAD